MRISAGKFKGRRTAPRRLLSCKGRTDLRPTSSKVREALFDILRNDLPGADFLDLYAGTGTVGLEALSRGAAKTVFVERDRMLAAAISECVSRMSLSANAEVHHAEAESFIRKAGAAGETFDIIFADPPYASEELSRVLPALDRGEVLKPGGSLVAEHSSRTVPPADFTFLRLVRRYKYGDTMLSLYRREE